MDIDREQELVALVRGAADMLERVGQGRDHRHAAGLARQFRAILRKMGYPDPPIIPRPDARGREDDAPKGDD